MTGLIAGILTLCLVAGAGVAAILHLLSETAQAIHGGDPAPGARDARGSRHQPDTNVAVRAEGGGPGHHHATEQ